MGKMNEKMKKNTLIGMLLIVVLLMSFGITKMLTSPTLTDAEDGLISQDMKVEVESIVLEQNDSINESEIVIPETTTTKNDLDANKNMSPEVKPQLIPPNEKPDTAPPQELLDENPDYISAADLEKEQENQEETEPVNTEDNQSEADEKPITQEPSNLVSVEQNPFINAGQSTDVDTSSGSDYGEGEWGNGDKF